MLLKDTSRSYELLWFDMITVGLRVERMVVCVEQITRLKIDHNPFAKGFRVYGCATEMNKRL